MKNEAIEELDADTYHANSALSNSQTLKIGRSVAHFLESKANPPDSDAMAKGRAVHTLALEGRKAFEAEYMYPAPDQDDRRTKAGKLWLARAEKDPRQIIRSSEADEVERINDALHDHPNAMRILRGPSVKNEVSYFAQDPEYPFDIRARIDAIAPNYIADLKTTRDASENGFTRSVSRYGYDHQWVFYSRVLDALGLEVPKTFLIVAVETAPPYAIGIYELDSPWWTRGRKLVLRNLQRWHDYLDGRLPYAGYTATAQPLPMPHYLEL